MSDVDSNNIAISVKNVSKTFMLPHEKQSSLKGKFLNSFKGKNYEKQEALKDINFDVKKGEFFGIVGRNGSGKSTLLKVIAGIYAPDSGTVKINGLLTPFIELGVGFNPELTGRENVFLNGALLGIDRKQMSEIYDEIVEFAELENFMDQKLKNYSSGMQVRLAFSIAIRAQSEILLLDEVLAVGDSAFQKKCFDYFEKLKDEKTTVILVTHSMESIERFCTRAMLVENGKIMKLGEPSEVAQLYSDINTISTANRLSNNKHIDDQQYRDVDIMLRLEGGEKSEKITTITPDVQELKMLIDIKPNTAIKNAALGIVVFNSRNVPIFATNTKLKDLRINLSKNEKLTLICDVQNIFSNDVYKIKLALKDTKGTRIYYVNDNAANFISIGRKHTYALVNPAHNLKRA